MEDELLEKLNWAIVVTLFVVSITLGYLVKGDILPEEPLGSLAIACAAAGMIMVLPLMAFATGKKGES